MSVENKFINKECEDYIEKMILKKDEIYTPFYEIEKVINQNTEINLSISKSQMGYFETLLSIQVPKTILEIGTFYGYSTACLAKFTPSDTEIITLDRDYRSQGYAKILLKEFFPEEFKKIAFKLGQATDLLDDILEEQKKFELIFIDADKNNYRNYFEKSIKMLAKNGIIVLDNIFQEGEVFKTEKAITEEFSADNRKRKRILNMQSLIEEICSNKTFSANIIPIGDGMLVVKKK